MTCHTDASQRTCQHAPRQCRHRCRALQSSHTRRASQALAGWRLIQDKYARAPFSALTAAHALEDAALHTHQLAAPPRTTWWIEEDDPKEPLERAIDCSSQLDGLAEHVRIHHKDSFGCAPIPRAAPVPVCDLF